MLNFGKKNLRILFQNGMYMIKKKLMKDRKTAYNSSLARFGF